MQWRDIIKIKTKFTTKILSQILFMRELVQFWVFMRTPLGRRLVGDFRVPTNAHPINQCIDALNVHLRKCMDYLTWCTTTPKSSNCCKFSYVVVSFCCYPLGLSIDEDMGGVDNHNLSIDWHEDSFIQTWSG